MSNLHDIVVSGVGVITVTKDRFVPASLMTCSTHETEMWWDSGEGAWYCGMCGYHEDPRGIKYLRPKNGDWGGWMPKEQSL